MNTNEASLGQSTVQTYSTTEKSDLERAVFALECTARWLDNGSDPEEAAEQIRLAVAQIKGCIANCEANSDPADVRQPAAIDKEAVAWFDKERNALRWRDGLVNANFRDGQPFYAAPLDTKASKPAPSVEQGERGANTFTKIGDSLTLTGAQLLEAFEFIAPDHPNDPDQLESEVTIQRGEGHSGDGFYCWVTDYPEEGAILLDGSSAARAASTSANVAQGAEAVVNALEETQGLLVAMLHEKRSTQEIEQQIGDNRTALQAFASAGLTAAQSASGDKA
jgi:hypothetical protein